MVGFIFGILFFIGAIVGAVLFCKYESEDTVENKVVDEVGTENLMQYYLLEQWDGKYPEYYVGSDNVSALIGIGGGN